MKCRLLLIGCGGRNCAVLCAVDIEVHHCLSDTHTTAKQARHHKIHAHAHSRLLETPWTVKDASRPFTESMQILPNVLRETTIDTAYRHTSS